MLFKLNKKNTIDYKKIMYPVSNSYLEKDKYIFDFSINESYPFLYIECKIKNFQNINIGFFSLILYKDDIEDEIIFNNISVMNQDILAYHNSNRLLSDIKKENFYSGGLQRFIIYPEFRNQRIGTTILNYIEYLMFHFYKLKIHKLSLLNVPDYENYSKEGIEKIKNFYILNGFIETNANTLGKCF